VTYVSQNDLLERVSELRRAGRPFVMATVVRCVRPASAKPGDRAVLYEDGHTEGWVGGGCVHASIRKEAAAALADGQPRLVRFSPEPHEEAGVVIYPMTCHSGGTLDIFLEPVLPQPDLVILGESPVADALAILAPPLGFSVHSSLDEAHTADTWVVSAAMSSDEDVPALRRAVEEDVAYVALVASRRRAAALVDELRADGASPAALDRLKAPAGLDIGARTPAEIALSILAEIVQRRRARAGASAPDPLRQSNVATDPICGMEVEVVSAKWTAEKDGQTFYFCAPGCRRAFLNAGK
jgi:xanthine dehydrogenase accessory factor